MINLKTSWESLVRLSVSQMCRLLHMALHQLAPPAAGEEEDAEGHDGGGESKEGQMVMKKR